MWFGIHFSIIQNSPTAFTDIINIFSFWKRKWHQFAFDDLQNHWKVGVKMFTWICHICVYSWDWLMYRMTRVLYDWREKEKNKMSSISNTDTYRLLSSRWIFLSDMANFKRMFSGHYYLKLTAFNTVWWDIWHLDEIINFFVHFLFHLVWCVFFSLVAYIFSFSSLAVSVTSLPSVVRALHQLIAVIVVMWIIMFDSKNHNHHTTIRWWWCLVGFLTSFFFRLSCISIHPSSANTHRSPSLFFLSPVLLSM